MKYFSAANVALFQLTGGTLGGKFRKPGNLRGVPVCLLTTRGRKTGKPRTKPLIYLADGVRIVLVASQNGMPRNPAWYLNLQAEPRVLIQTGRYRRRMRARTADDQERAELWVRHEAHCYIARQTGRDERRLSLDLMPNRNPKG